MGIFGKFWHKVSGSNSGEKDKDSMTADTSTDQPSNEPKTIPQEPAAPAEEGEKEAPTINPQPDDSQSEAESPNQSEGGAEGEGKQL